MSENPLINRAKIIIIEWAMALPASQRGARDWTVDDIKNDLTTRVFNTNQGRGEELLKSLRNVLKLVITPKWADTFGEIFDHREIISTIDPSEIITPEQLTAQIRQPFKPGWDG